MFRHGYTAVKHQREVGTGYFDYVAQAAAGGISSTTALKGSTEEAQFHTATAPADEDEIVTVNTSSFEHCNFSYCFKLREILKIYIRSFLDYRSHGKRRCNNPDSRCVAILERFAFHI